MIKLIPHLLIFCFLFALQLGVGQKLSFTKQETQEDLTYLRDQLLQKHANLWVYNTKEDFDAFFKNLELPKRMTASEAYGFVASTSSIIQDGHTLFYPDFQLIKKNNKNGRFFPLSVFWDGDNLFIRASYSNNNESIKGAKIISINEVKSEKIVAFILQRMMRDGNNFNYPIWVINQYFFEYYSYFYGCPKVFQFLLEHQDGRQEKVIIEGLLKADLLSKIKAQRKEEKAIAATFIASSSTAILTVKDWHSNILKKYYQQNFKKEITQKFEQIQAKNIENLIIDVRDNQGGDTKNSKLLLSYLLDQPFELVEEYKVVKNGKIIDARGPQMGWQQVKKERFKGKIFVLINGGSFSNTGIFCSILRKHNRATFIGKETGGSEFVICGSPKSITLPNTKIQVDIPRLQFLIKAYTKADLSGIKPDHEIKPTIQDLIGEKDLAKELAIQLIQETM